MAQLDRVERAMLDGEWHTLAALSKRLRIGEACLSAHIRSLRKPKHGGWIVERAYMESDESAGRCFHYRLLTVPMLNDTDIEDIVQKVLRDVLEKAVFPTVLDMVKPIADRRSDEIFGAMNRYRGAA